jgi:hypothetical protein
MADIGLSDEDLARLRRDLEPELSWHWPARDDISAPIPQQHPDAEPPPLDPGEPLRTFRETPTDPVQAMASYIARYAAEHPERDVPDFRAIARTAGFADVPDTIKVTYLVAAPDGNDEPVG